MGNEKREPLDTTDGPYFAAVRDGVSDALSNGPFKGYEMVGVNLTLTDGSQQDEDSSDWAFRLCAAEAMRAVVLPQCRAELLEPMMELEIEVPSEFQGKNFPSFKILGSTRIVSQQVSIVFLPFEGVGER